jgi:hypothetical protein
MNVSWLAACVPGITDPTVTTCNPDGSNRNVTVANYTCIPGVAIKVAAPVYCLLMPSMRPAGSIGPHYPADLHP